MKSVVVAALLLGICLTARAQNVAATQPAITTDELFILQRPIESQKLALPLLHRELVRQAVLIAARDESGLYTRDEILRETVPAGAGDMAARTLRASVDQFRNSEIIHIGVAGGTPWTKTEPLLFRGARGQRVLDETSSLPLIEALSRKDFVVLLKGLGFTGQPAAAGQAELPAEVETRLGELSIISQFDAVRRIHALIRQSGESPALLGGLVRGYANLGSVTRFQWTAATEVFAARSLLYGERLVVKYPSPSAHQHLAYAMAVVGLHGAALAELKKGPVGAGSPPWAQLIEPLCKYDTQVLLGQVAMSPANAPLATYLALMTVEHSGSVATLMSTGRLAQQYNPLCEQVIDAMLQSGGIATMNRYIPVSFNVDVDQMRQGLEDIAPLPANVEAARLTAHNNPNLTQDLADVSQSLVDASDTSEPSLSALGRLLQESNFIHAYQQVVYMGGLGVDPTQAISSSAPMVTNHPYASVITKMGADRQRGQPALADVPIAWVDLKMGQLGGEYGMGWSLSANAAAWQTAWQQAEWHINSTAYDVESSMVIESNQNMSGDLKKHALAMRWISPFSPLGVAALLQTDWAAQKGHLDQWLAQTGNQPAVLAVTAKQLYGDKDYAAASKYLREYISVAPDAWAYILLADCQLSQNNEAGWLQTLQDGMKQEDFALSTAEINDIIANHYMSQREYLKARPYADAGAESWAAWAIECAMYCHLHLEDWDAAETFSERQNDRYQPFLQWYLWCRASGHGNLAAAKASAIKYVAAGDIDLSLLGCYYAGERDAADEIATVKKAAAEQADPLWQLWLATVYDAAGQTAQRDTAIAEAIQVKPPEYQDEIQLAQMFQDAVVHHDGQLDMNGFGKTFANLSPQRRATVEYFAAEWLIHRGHPDQGIDLLKRVAVEQDDNSMTGWLARIDLHDRGGDPYGLPAPTH